MDVKVFVFVLIVSALVWIAIWWFAPWWISLPLTIAFFCFGTGRRSN